MNTTTTRYTPLESLLLFQSLLSHGLEAAAFLHISSLLQNNSLVKGSPNYDAGRLSPEALQELFLHLLREELKTESENAENPDTTGLSPNSRKRKLASPPLPTLQEARQHVTKLPILVDRLYARYRDHALRGIREDEERYDGLQTEIHDLEASDLAAKDPNNAPVSVPVTSGQNGPQVVSASMAAADVKPPNGTPRTTQSPQQQPTPLQPRSQPQNHPQIQPQPQSQSRPPSLQPQPQPQLQPQFQPIQPQLPSQPSPQAGTRPQEPHNGVATPQPLQSPLERSDTATPPALTSQPSAASQSQPSRSATSSAVASPLVRQPELSRPHNGPPQVLQPPQGVGFPTARQGPSPPQVQGEGLQRPEGIGRGKISPVPQLNQPTGSGQLKWEPLYQPNQMPPQYRQPQAPGQFQAPSQPQRPQGGPQAPQAVPQQPQQQWNQQVPSPYGSPRPPQVQAAPQPDQPLQQSMQQPVQQSAQQQPQLQQPPQQQQLVQQQVQQQVPQQIQHQPLHPIQRPVEVQQPVHRGIQLPVQQQAFQPPQATGQFSPALQPGPIRTPSAAGHASTTSRTPTPGKSTAQGRPSQPVLAAQVPHSGYQQPPQNRPLAAAQSPAPGFGQAQGPKNSQQRSQTPQPVGQRSPHPPVQLPSGGPPGATSAAISSYGAYTRQNQPLLPGRKIRPAAGAIPAHVLQQQQHNQQYTDHAGPATPASVSRISPMGSAPQTPVSGFKSYQYLGGSGTTWKLSVTPSTPRRDVGVDMPSPAYEPLSPVLAPAVLPAASSAVPPTPSPLPPATPAEVTPHAEPRKAASPQEPLGSVSPVAKRRGRLRRSTPNVPDPSLLTPVPQPAASHAASSPSRELRHSTKEAGPTVIKHEETTPQPPTEAGDTTADESVTGRRRVSRAAKRKRQEMSLTPAENSVPPGPPTHVAWTRSFNKVSHSAMEQIVGHRDANLFAHQIRERDAPGYRNRILMPQDLRSIRNAINHGNRAAAAAAAALPGGDPGTSSVLLPISEELVPPKGIVNSSQLDRELAHMLANAIMYNPDPNRGPGPAFMRSEAEVDAEDEENGAPVLGYKVDENGVVNNARAMFVEVEKLLSDMRAAEIQKGAPASAATPHGTSTRQASVAAGLGETPARRDEAGSSTADGDRDEQTPTEPENVGNVSKRRRITRG